MRWSRVLMALLLWVSASSCFVQIREPKPQAQVSYATDAGVDGK